MTTKQLLIPAGLVVLLLVGVSGWQGHQANQFRAERDSALAVSAQRRAIDSVTAQEGVAAGLRADSAEAEADRLRRVADSLSARPRASQPPAPDSTASDSVRYWRARAVVAEDDARTAHQALEARTAEASDLRVALEAQQAATAKFRAAYEGEQKRADGLEQTLRRAPTGCAKLLGIPVPRFGPGGVLTRHGADVGLAVIVPLGGC